MNAVHLRRFGPSVVALVLALTAARGNAVAQAPPGEAQVKAAFVYNFLKFVEWPSSYLPEPGDSLVVAIAGEGPTADAVSVLLAGKTMNGRTIVVVRLSDDVVQSGVHALFIGNANAVRTRRLLRTVANSAVLSIGESTGFAARGGVIGLVVEEKRIRFEINSDAAATARLTLSSKLLTLARIVPPDPADRSAPR